jgi:hypothetical protein
MQDQAAALAQAVAVFNLGGQAHTAPVLPGVARPSARLGPAKKTAAAVKSLPQAVKKPISKVAGGQSDDWEEF